MSGKLCTGATTNNAYLPKNSRAYCEGIDYRMSGTAIAKPITDNPHEADSEAADAWGLGWAAIETDAGSTSTLIQNCCAVDTTKTILV